MHTFLHKSLTWLLLPTGLIASLPVAAQNQAIKAQLATQPSVPENRPAQIDTPKKSNPTRYLATYTNTLNEAVNDLTVTLPIPEDMIYIGGAEPVSAQATIDGKHYVDLPITKQVDGKIVKVPFAKYKALRWHIKYLPAKKTATVSILTLADKS